MKNSDHNKVAFRSLNTQQLMRMKELLNGRGPISRAIANIIKVDEMPSLQTSSRQSTRSHFN